MKAKKVETPASSKDAADRVSNQTIPWTSTLDDLFSGGASVWFKIVGAACATPLIVIFAVLRIERSKGMTFPREPWIIITSLICFAVAGAILGAALSLKDIVQARMTAGRPFAFPLNALFGYGIWSALLVWCPVAMVVTLAATMATIGW